MNKLIDKKKIVMCGNHIGGKGIIEYLLKNGIQFDCFVILSREQSEKYSVSGFYDYSVLAKEYKIDIYYPKRFDLKDEKDIEFFKKKKFDLMLQGGWQRIFSKEILNTLKYGAIGMHGSSNFLPRGRGRSPFNWSLIEGKKRFIYQFFFLKPGKDDGDVFHFEQFDINEYDDIETLYFKGEIVSKKTLLEYIPKILNGNVKTKNQVGDSTHYNKRTPQDGLIRFKEMEIDVVFNLVRAVTHPYPGAFCYIKNEKIFIWRAQIFDRNLKYPDAEYGEVVEIFKNRFVVNCLGGLLLVNDYEHTNDKIIKLGDIFELE